MLRVAQLTDVLHSVTESRLCTTIVYNEENFKHDICLSVTVQTHCSLVPPSCLAFLDRFKANNISICVLGARTVNLHLCDCEYTIKVYSAKISVSVDTSTDTWSGSGTHLKASLQASLCLNRTTEKLQFLSVNAATDTRRE